MAKRRDGSSYHYPANRPSLARKAACLNRNPCRRRRFGNRPLGDRAPTAAGDDFGKAFAALGAHAAFAPPDTGHFQAHPERPRRNRKLHARHSYNARRRRRNPASVQVGQFAAACRLGHGPFGRSIVVEPAGVVDQDG